MNYLAKLLGHVVKTIVVKAFEAATSKKAWAAGTGIALAQSTDDPKKQLTAAGLAAAYVIAQGLVDAAKAKK